MKAKEKIVLFADYGLDDASATAHVLDHADRFDEIVIIPIGGNVPTAVSHRNCYTILSHYPALWDKITVVSTLHLVQPFENLTDIHGGDGMGDILTVPAVQPAVREIPFEKWLAEEYTGRETLLSLGPMTLVRPVLEKHPCRRLVIMGGCIREEPNFCGREFNHALDTEAFAYCVRYPHEAVTLDTVRGAAVLDMRGREIEGDGLHARFLRADQALSITRGEAGCYVWDDVAAAFVLHPDRFAVQPERDPDGNLVNNLVYTSEALYFADGEKEQEQAHEADLAY